MHRIASDRPFLIALITLLLTAVLGTVAAGGMLGRTFPGFVLLPNAVVASAGVPGWAATANGEIYQHEVLRVDGRRVESTAQIYDLTRAQPAGSNLVYQFRNPQSGETFTRTIPTRVFSSLDALLLHGVYLFNGIALGLAALVVRLRARESAAARATLPFLLVGALWGLTAMDLYGPARLFRLHVLCESLLAPAILHMALSFPRAVGTSQFRRRLIEIVTAATALLVLAYQALCWNPAGYVTAHLIATSAAGSGLALFVLAQIWRFGANHVEQERRLPAGIFLGTVLALLVPIFITIAEPITGGSSSQNLVGFSIFVFPLSLVHATTRLQLFAEVKATQSA